MAYREPCSSIFLFKGCPCDRSYNNTIYFEDRTAQWVYFRDHYFSADRSKSYSNQYYQRYGKGTLRIQEKADNLYEFNYMAFCNDNGFNPLVGPTGAMKVFYCFIDSKEYINEHTTEVTYTIDVIQTYMFNYTLGNCFVEREHTITDELYENLIEENFDPSNYTEEILSTKEFNHWCVHIQYIVNQTVDTTINNAISSWHKSTGSPTIFFDEIHLNYGASYRNDTFVGYQTLTFALKGLDGQASTAAVQSAIEKLVSLSAQIIGIYMLPYELVNEIWANVEWSQINMEETHYCLMYKSYNSATYNSDVITIQHPTYFKGRGNDTYTPKNKKLYMYPYQSIKISNNQGETDEMMFENFNGDAKFGIKGCEQPQPEITLYAEYYNSQSLNIEHRITLSNIISCMWSEDSAARFWTENKNKTNMAMLGSLMTIIGSVGVSYITKNPSPTIGAVGATIRQYQRINEQAGQNLLTSGNAVYDKINADFGRTKTVPTKMPNITTNKNQAAAGALAAAYTVSNIMDLENKRDNPLGKTAYSSILRYLNGFGFKIIYKGIKPYEAKRIDDYFTLYGYAIKSLKVPNIISEPVSRLRPHWNYIKNANTVVLPKITNNVTSYVDSDVEEELQEIYNKGITFWMDGEEVGDYSLDNSPNV